VVPGELEQPANVAASESIAYFSGLLDERRSHPRDDVISLLVAAARDRAEFTPEDLIATIVLLMAAGFETTRYTIAGGLVALSESGTALEVAREQVRANGLLSNDAIEELLRHQGPIHAALARQSTQDEQFGPMTIPAGEPVVVMTAAANRDPAVYAAPDRLDLERQGPRALSFGHGPHYCLGAHLAKQEINEAISAILQRYDDIECVRPPQPKGSFNVRGPQGARLRLR
jgi:cytochrome P450